MLKSELLYEQGRCVDTLGPVMADAPTTLKRLLEVRRVLREQLNEVDSWIEQLEGIHTKVQNFSPTIFDFSRQTEVAAKPRLRQRSLTSPSEIANRVERFLQEAGRPMTRSEIASKLTESGVLLVGVDVNKNVGTIMWRHRDRFVNLPKLGYWLAREPLPGVYEPNNE